MGWFLTGSVSPYRSEQRRILLDPDTFPSFSSRFLPLFWSFAHEDSAREVIVSSRLIPSGRSRCAEENGAPEA